MAIKNCTILPDLSVHMEEDYQGLVQQRNQECSHNSLAVNAMRRHDEERGGTLIDWVYGRGIVTSSFASLGVNPPKMSHVILLIELNRALLLLVAN